MPKMQIEDNHNLNLKNKNILITGGAVGIGAYVVRLLQIEGAKTFVIDKQKTEIQEKIVDIRDRTTIHNFIDKLPLLNGLVLNAGLGPFHENPIEIFETNIIGTLNVLKACKEKFTDFSSIIIISSTAGYRDTWDNKWLQCLDFQKKQSFDYK